ncbi:MAG: glycosyltransferase family 4 protein, partial [Frankiaceae bacterium]
MRILHVNKYLYRRGGAESYLFDLSDLQRQAGHEVACFGMQHPDNDVHPFARFFPRQIELEPAPPGARKKAAAVARMVWSSSSRRGLTACLDDFRPDVVHLHNIYHQLSPSILAATRAAGVPTVMTLHDYKLACPSYQLLDHGRVCDACITGGPWQAARRRCKDDSLGASAVLALESWLHRLTGAYDGVDAFICPSRFLAQAMAAAGVYPERMFVVRHFVDLAGVPSAAEPGSSF